MEHYDVVIIGSGAGGATLLHALAPTGKRILMLERGGYLPRELDNWNSRAVFVDNKYKTKERWLDSDGREFKPEIHYFVGGQSKLYGAALPRFRAEDFGELRHAEGISPAWPVGYDEFEPWYTAAERLYHVHGEAGLDPTEPRRSAPFPHPPLKHEPRIQEVHDALVALGHRPFPLQMGIMLDQAAPEHSACIRCATCDGYPCLVHAKAEAETVCIRPALQRPNVTLLTHAFVERLDTDASGRTVTTVHVVRDGKREEYRGDVVVSSCGAINSAALLLRSKSDAHPRGLANANDCVGRYYMCHNNSVYVAVSMWRNPTKFQKTLGLNDFYLGTDGFEFPLGHVQTMGKADGEKFEAASPVWLPFALLDQIGKHSLDFWLTSEDLPDRDNRIDVNADGRIVIRYRQNNLKCHDLLNKKLTAVLRKVFRKRAPLGLVKCLRKKVPVHGVTHQCGTLRFGDDPGTSVLDRNCKAHGVDNLYVVDGSFFPSSAALNPALTIFANALRVGEHLKQRLG
ncbi:MAG: GMC family oxidoreductase [Planctomycetes bacterium]|nr:GMC family oxidoreductase [Planctomycetota bacterium]